MPTSNLAPRLRALLIIALLWVLPMHASAQRQGSQPSVDPLASPDSVIIVESVRVRTAPSPQSLSIDEVGRGTVLAIEAGTKLGGPWIAVRFDERTAFVPREYVTVKMGPRAPVSSTSSPAPAPAPVTPAPSRVAMTSPQTAPATAPVQSTPAPVREAPAPTRETVPAVRESPAPVRQAGAPTQTGARQAAAETTAPTRVSSAPTPATPVPARETTPVELPSTAPKTAPESGAQNPSRMWRPALPGMVSVALLGSVTPYTVTTTGERVLHLSGHALVTLNVLGWGLYAAPEYGSGAGHRSTMLGGGLLRQILPFGPVHVAALAGVTIYAEAPEGDYSASFVTRTIRAGSAGALISVPFVGPTRLAYRGQYLKGLGADADFHKIRHAVGVQF